MIVSILLNIPPAAVIAIGRTGGTLLDLCDLRRLCARRQRQVGCTTDKPIKSRRLMLPPDQNSHLIGEIYASERGSHEMEGIMSPCPGWVDSVEKSFLADEPNFLGPLMRSTRGDVRDHIDLNKRDRETSYWS
jgi:hypothetical protein